MKRFALLLAAMCLTGFAQHAAAQGDMQNKTGPPMKTPADPTKTPSDPGAVIVPPRTGTEDIVKTPNKAVDPEIDDATEDIDRKNRKRSEQKLQKRER